MQKLTGTLRSYPWGSRTLIPELRGLPSPSTRPEAELWFGAHPVGSSTIQDRALTDIIAADPVAALGSRVYGQYGDNLPFLLKILAAAEPLSLQAHPSAEQAREGFERENRLGIPLNAGNRNYRDPRHKPELVVALTDFHAMVGFRPLDQTLELFAVLACPELDRYLTILDPAAETDSLRGLFTTWITIPSAARRQLIDAVVAAAGLLAALTLTACGGDNAADPATDTTDGAAADATDRTFDVSGVEKVDEIAALLPQAVADKGTLTVGASTDYAPAEFRADDLTTAIGYDVDLSKALGKVLGLEAEVVDGEFASLIPGIGSKYDVGISSFTIRDM